MPDDLSLFEDDLGGPPPDVVRSDRIYDGRIVSLRVDTLTLPGDRSTVREVIEHPGAVVMVALDDERHVYLVRQYRHAIGRTLLELPAGTLEPGEEPLQSAKRELREEVGLTAKQWTPLGSFFSSPGILNEPLHVFLAQGLTQVGSEPDFDEDLSVVRLPLDSLCSQRAQIHDAKTLAALYLLQEDSCRGTDA